MAQPAIIPRAPAKDLARLAQRQRRVHMMRLVHHHFLLSSVRFLPRIVLLKILAEAKEAKGKNDSEVDMDATLDMPTLVSMVKQHRHDTSAHERARRFARGGGALRLLLLSRARLHLPRARRDSGDRAVNSPLGVERTSRRPAEGRAHCCLSS